MQLPLFGAPCRPRGDLAELASVIHGRKHAAGTTMGSAGAIIRNPSDPFGSALEYLRPEERLTSAHWAGLDHTFRRHPRPLGGIALRRGSMSRLALGGSFLASELAAPWTPARWQRLDQAGGNGVGGTASRISSAGHARREPEPISRNPYHALAWPLPRDARLNHIGLSERFWTGTANRTAIRSSAFRQKPALAIAS